MLIPHSNMYVENMFSHVNTIKTPLRNSLNVSTVASLFKDKSYYLNNENYFAEKDELLERHILFEQEAKHYRFYKLCIKHE